MTTDTAVLEQALVVMAICMAVQTVMFVAAAIAGFMAWRRTTEALDHVSATVDDVASALIRSTSAVDGVMTDVRDAMGTVRNSVGTVASVISGPRTALALGVLRGVQSWRKSRAARRIDSAAPSEL